MLAHRIIPTMLCRGRQLVKGKQFNNWRSVGLVMQAVQIHAARGVDELCLLDVAATIEGRGPDLELVRELSDVLFAPFSVGGGIRSVDDVRALLRAGADKVVIGTGAWECPGLIQDVAAIVGRQAVTVSVDVKHGYVWTRCGSLGLGLDPAAWALSAEHHGAGEILLQSIERDGTGLGYDLELIRAVSPAVSIPVIASGGAGNYQHMLEAIQAGAPAVAAGALFQFEDATPRGAAQYLASKGIEVRL
jgi:cyclase